MNPETRWPRPRLWFGTERFGRRPTQGLLILLALLLLASEAWAGVIIEETIALEGGRSNTSNPGVGPMNRVSKTYLQGRMVRIETGDQVLVFDLDGSRFLSINLKTRTYTEYTRDQVREAQRQALARASGRREKRENQEQALSSDKQREMKKKPDALSPAGGGQQERPPKIEVKATGREQVISGFPCQEYEVHRDGVKSSTCWLTKAIEVKEYQVYQQERGKWLAALGPAMNTQIQEWGAIRNLGFPVRLIGSTPVSDKLILTREVTRVEHESLSDSLFQVPGDFKRVEAPVLPANAPLKKEEPKP